MGNTSPPVIKRGTGCLDSLYSNHIVAPTLDTWYDAGATPNCLTTLGLLSTGGSIYALYKHHHGTAIMLLLLRMYFDFADGMLARKYRMTSEFGDYYDHLCDMFFFIGIVVALWKIFPPRQRGAILLLLFIVGILQTLQYSRMQSNHIDEEHSNSLSCLQWFHGFVCSPRAAMLDYVDGTLFYMTLIGIILFHKCGGHASPTTENLPLE